MEMGCPTDLMAAASTDQACATPSAAAREQACSILGGPQVATPRDPASARLGESLYTFLPRSVVGNLRDGVVMELDRLRARHLPFFCLHNR